MTSGLEGFLGKLEVTNDIGETLDKHLQKAEDQVQQLLGGATALKVGSVKVGALGEHVDKDLNEGKLQFESELAAAAYVKDYLRRAGEVLLNLAEKSKTEELVARGKATALRESLEVVGRHCKSAKVRAEQLAAAAEAVAAAAKGEPTEPAEEGPRGGARMPGERPGRSTLDERRAEARAAEARAGQETAPAEDSQAKLPVEPSAEQPAQPAAKPPAPAPKPAAKKKAKTKKRTTKKKAKTNRKPSARAPTPQG